MCYAVISFVIGRSFLRAVLGGFPIYKVMVASFIETNSDLALVLRSFFLSFGVETLHCRTSLLLMSSNLKYRDSNIISK